MRGAALAGTGALVRFLARRDRAGLAAWAALGAGLPVFNAYSLGALLPTPEAREVFAAGSDGNPVVAVLLGPISDTSLEGVVAWRSGLQSLLVTGVAGIVFTVRHTRAEEDAGRREAVAACAVGRHAPLTAVLAVTAAVNLAVAALTAAALALGPGFPFGGSLLFGLTAAAGGTALAAAGALAAQLAQTAALARTLAIGALAASLGPFVAGARPWPLPAEWPRLARPYADARWWAPLVPLAAAAILAAAACAVSARRDLGSGLLPDRAGTTGPAAATPRLSGPLALAWRTSGERLVSWAAALAVVGAAVGAVSVTLDATFAESDLIRRLLGRLAAQSPGDALLAIFTYVFCLVIAALSVVVALTPLAEEERGHAGAVLAAAVSRPRWLAAHLLLSLAAPAALLAVTGLASGLAAALATGRAAPLPAQLAATAHFIPAAWTVAAVALAVYGLRPRLAAPAAWAFLAVSALAIALWEAAVIPRAAFLLTPFAYAHPTITPAPAAPLALTLLTALLLAVATTSFTRRDLLT
ncbi:ABC transporter permease [Bailinhaonella thermotolerans]|uniref:ABC transporter permease n=1 Tax=Bailinhaonella thermotolerans TaxID=1070861 RepID=A0A3A4ARA1_9ACTN|nr:ABC transporter permease [Bailinhaonella thermotolerans]RJL31621.1 ABC transporter permease [Bailinhaonella thermotolerans]